MENSDIDMVISIPDTPDRAIRRGGSIKRRNQSPEASSLRYHHQRDEYRNCVNGRTVENRGNSDTHRRDGSGRSSNNALFRRPTDKGKSICTDLPPPRAARVERNSVLNLNQHNDNAKSSSCSPLSKGKGKADCVSDANRETIDLSSDKQQGRGTKRLVRYGCISPNGIAARAREVVVETNPDDIVSVEQEEVAPETASSVDIMDFVSGTDINGRIRGKRPVISRSRVTSRDAVGLEAEGWISTGHRKSNIGQETSRRDVSDAHGISSSISELEMYEVTAVEREARQHRRRRNGVTSARASNEPEVSVILSSAEPSSSRPPRIRDYQRHGRQVLEIEDSSPDVRVSRGPRQVENNEPDVNVRQIEADERLARELQEQLYQESTQIRHEQIDENIARLLEQEENAFRASSSRPSTRNTRNPNTIAANTSGRRRLEARLGLQQHASGRRSNPPQTRAAVRAPPRGRGRGQRVGHAHFSRHRAMNLNFPNDMSFESRLDFLEELESAMGHSVNHASLLHMDRDFTEDDYEMLLALDDNNHRHGGASISRINNLPESTVQSDNYQETCVICLETPTIGDSIRHLPCLHKFHKDCIDPWLGRSKSCPVCKSSVT